MYFFGGDPVDDKVTAVVPIQPADDVQQGGLAGAGGAQDGDKFAVAQVQADIIQCGLYKVTGFVFLADLFQLKHRQAFLMRTRRRVGNAGQKTK